MKTEWDPSPTDPIKCIEEAVKIMKNEPPYKGPMPLTPTEVIILNKFFKSLRDKDK